MKISGTGFSDDTRRVLAAAGLSEGEIADLARTVEALVRSPPLRMPTLSRARDEAARLAVQAQSLTDLLDTATIVESLPTVARLVDGGTALDLAVLRDQLHHLGDAVLALHAATGDDPTAPQLALPSGGGHPLDTAARAVCSVTLWRLHVAGGQVTTGETGAAVRCVAAVFAECGIAADARAQVRDWVKRHPLA